MTEEDPIRRQKRWQPFYEEPGGLRDMLSEMRAAYFMRMSVVEPWEVAKLANLAIAAKQIDMLDTAVLRIISDGKTAQAANDHADRVAAIPDYKRRWATGA